MYQICDGNAISLYSNDEISPDLERLPLFGFGLAAVLCQRGLWVFHGSAVEVNGQAVVIVGDKTAGKSTLISAFISKGYQLISDDVTALSILNNEIYVLPGTPSIKLWPDAAAAIGLGVNNLPKVHQYTEKRNYIIKERFCDQGRRIDTVIVLGYGEKLVLKELLRAEKILNLSCSNYFSNSQQLFSNEDRKDIFRQCAFLAKNMRVFQFDRPWDLNLLPQTVEMIITAISEKKREKRKG
jgi:hypothetical protein